MTTAVIILDHPMDHMVKGDDLENIYISPAGNAMWEVARGNTMRGILYSLEDAKLFAEVIKVPEYCSCKGKRYFENGKCLTCGRS